MQMLDSSPQSRFPVEDPTHVAECRRAAQYLAESLGFDATLVGRVGIIATELSTNLLKHAGYGEILLQSINDGEEVSLELVSIDNGPGMQVDTCMRDGYSTAGSAGTGLGAILRLSNLFDVYSVEAQGTVVVSRIAKQSADGVRCRPPTSGAFDLGAVCVALAGEIECGDTWKIAREGHVSVIMVADGLGHGPLAASAARDAASAFAKSPLGSPAEIMQHMHHALSGGRGAAAACAALDAAKAKLCYAGVGNISAAVVSPERSKGLVSHNGILGVQLPRKQQFEYDWSPECLIVMHSDGMSARWAIGKYPGLVLHHAAVIAAVLYRDHRRARDDVTVVVMSAKA